MRKHINIMRTGITMLTVIVMSLALGCSYSDDDGSLDMGWNPIFNEAPVAEFEHGISYAKGSTQFYNRSTDPNLDRLTHFRWEFGDGAFSTEEDPAHRYSNPGDYTVTLLVEDDHGATASRSETIRVAPVPKIDLILHNICTRETGDGDSPGEIYLKLIVFDGRDTTKIESNTMRYKVPPGGCVPFGRRIVIYSGVPDDYVAFIIIAIDHDDLSFWSKVVGFAKSVFGAVVSFFTGSSAISEATSGLFEIADYAIKEAGQDDVVLICHDVLLPNENWSLGETTQILEYDHPNRSAVYWITYSVAPH